MVILLQTVTTPENPRRVIKEFSGPLLKTPENPHYEIDIFTHIYIYMFPPVDRIQNLFKNLSTWQQT